MQCNLSLIELELTIENTIYTINCTQSDIFISFQKIPDDDESLLSWLLKQSSWDNRDPCFCFSRPFSSLFSVLALSSCARVRSLPKSKCSEVTAKQAQSKDICSYVPMQCTYVLTLNEFLFHESLLKLSEKQRLLTHIFTLSNAMSSEEVQ